MKNYHLKHLVTLILSLLFASTGSPLSAQPDQLTLEQLLLEEQAQSPNRGARAQLVPVNRTMLAAGLAAKIESVNYAVGEHVEENAVLIEFDCDSLSAEERIYRAQRQVSEINLQVKQRLLELNNIAPLELQLAQAELAAATAQVEVISVELEECSIHAPFTGTVVSRQIEPYQYVAEGEPMLELLSKDDLEVLLVAPSSWLTWLAPGINFMLYVEEVEQMLTGEVARLGGRVDPISQTILVYGKLTETSDKLLPGMSGDIQFLQGATR